VSGHLLWELLLQRSGGELSELSSIPESLAEELAMLDIA